MRGEALRRRAEWLAALVWPRRCPICGALLGPDARDGLLCPACAPETDALACRPPRLHAERHAWYALAGAASAFRYEGVVREAVLQAKAGDRPWAARELADLVAVRVFGAAGPAAPGRPPVYEPLAGLPLYEAVVPVPPRHPGRGVLPARMARRLGRVLGLPVVQALTPTRQMAPQKSLDHAARLANTRGGYAVRRGLDLSGQRILLVDDILTTGATASACAMALLQAGAVSVFAVTLAAAGEAPPDDSHQPSITRPDRRKQLP